MSDTLQHELERVWQLLMVIGEDSLARSVANAKQRLLRYEAQLRGEPVVITATLGDSIDSKDGAG